MQEDVNNCVNDYIINVFKDVVKLSPSEWQDSPFATGWLANQWYPSVRSPSPSIDERRDLLGFNSLDRIEQLRGEKNFLTKDNSVFLTNNVPHAYQAEVIGWQFTKPYAMIATAVDNAKGKSL